VHFAGGPRRSRWAAALTVAATCAAGAACARAPSAPYAHAFSAAERAQTAGRFAEAAAEFDRAAAGAKTPRDRDHAAYLAAEMLVRAGDVAAGARRLDAIARLDPPGEHSAHAAYELAVMRVERDDDWTEIESMPLRFPESALSRRALYRAAAHLDERDGPAAGLAWLERLAPRLAGRELEQTTLYEIARHHETLGDVARARDEYIAIATRWPYPGGALWDDALFRASEADERLGRYDAAIADLERMLDEREVSTVMGTYQRPRYGPALLRIATLYRDRLHDRARARAALHRLYTDFKTSPSRDDALWMEAELFIEDGDRPTACARLASLVRDFPDSRYVPCATLRCNDVARPAQSAAPKACRAYIDANASSAADGTNGK